MIVSSGNGGISHSDSFIPLVDLFLHDILTVTDLGIFDALVTVGYDSSLDLNLGISLSSDGSKGNDTRRNLQFPHMSSELLDGKRLKVN